MKRWRRLGAALPAAALAAACAGPPPVSPTLALETESLAPDAEVAAVARDVEARVVTHFIFWVPTRTLGPTISEALAAALERGNGQVLTNASVERVAWYVPLLYGEYGWVVRGDVVRLRKPHPPPAPQP